MNIQTVVLNNISYVNVTKPAELDIKYLKNNFGFSTLHLDDYINKTQVPKVETMKDYILIVLDFPFIPQSTQSSATTPKNEATTPKKALDAILNLPPTALSSVPLPQFSSGDKKRRLFASQIDIFIGKDYVVVVHEGVLVPLSDIFTQCQKTLNNRKEYLGEGPVFLAYRIIDALVDSTFPILNELTSEIDKIDRELEDKPTADTLERISQIRRNIVVFQTMIKPMLPLFRQVEEGQHKQLNGTMQQFWGNVVDHLQKIWDRLEDSRELIEGISESNESLLTSKTNEIIKVLTIFSAIILPLNLAASIYGMNIKLPYAEEPSLFWILMFLMIIAWIVMLFTFKSKRWF